MKSIKSIFLPIILVAAFISCKNDAPKQETTSQNVVVAADSIKPLVGAETAKDTSKEEVLTLIAMFVDFTLGDAEHYSFKDKSGKMWNFGGCEAKNFTFSEELPESKANSENQGYGSNKALQKKWFDLKYVYRMQPEYLEGPIGKVPVIIEATMQK